MRQPNTNSRFAGQDRPALYFARDPIVEINDSFPIRPDLGRPTSQDLWEESIRQNQERRKPTPKQPDSKRPDSDRLVDDFA